MQSQYELARLVHCLCLSLQKAPELNTRPRTAREENGSQLICLHSRIPLWRGSPIPHPPSLPPTLLHWQTWASLDGCQPLTALFDKGDMEKFVRFVPEDGCHSLGENVEFCEAADPCSGIIIPGLLVCAQDETEGNLQGPDWMCKFCVCITSFPPLCSKLEMLSYWIAIKAVGQSGWSKQTGSKYSDLFVGYTIRSIALLCLHFVDLFSLVEPSMPANFPASGTLHISQLHRPIRHPRQYLLSWCNQVISLSKITAIIRMQKPVATIH